MAPTAGNDNDHSRVPFANTGANDSALHHPDETIPVLRAKWERVQAENLRLTQENSALRKERDAALSRSVTDVLTGISNRRGSDAALHGQVSQFLRDHDARRHMSDRLVVISMDLDGLKTANDEHGHDIGDELLKNFVDRIKLVVREGDSFGRLGGDEFRISMVTPQPAHAKERFMAARASMDAIPSTAPVEERTAFSLGFAYLTHNQLDSMVKSLHEQSGDKNLGAKDLSVDDLVMNLVKQADVEMYKDKAPRKAARLARARKATPAAPAAGVA